LRRLDNSAGSRKPHGRAPSVAGKNLEQRAYAAVASVGYSWTNVSAKPRLALEYLYSSGDSNPTDGKHQTFDNLFPTNHRQFGIMDIFSWQNDQIVRFMSSIQPLKTLTLAADYRLIWLADTRDSFYTSKGARRGGLAPTLVQATERIQISTATLAPKLTWSRPMPSNVLHHSRRLWTLFCRGLCESSLARIGGARDATVAYAQFTLNF